MKPRLPQVDLRLIPRHADVYEPCEDSFLLVDALTNDLPRFISSPPRIVLELGCGSGYVSCSLALALKEHNVRPFFLGIDVNPVATEISRQTFLQHNIRTCDFVTADLLSSFAFQKEISPDIVVFNPPYVPTPDEEVTKGGIARAWAGGVRGRRVTDRAISQVCRALPPHGLFYLLLLAENDVGEVREMLQEQGFYSEVVLARGTDEESLLVLRIQQGHTGQM